MTPKQALDRIRAAGPCFVIFDANTGEVLEVQAKGAADRPETLIGTMGSAANAHGPVKGRFFESCVTLEMLEHEVEESLRVAGRVAIFSRWALLPAEELVHVLETDDFAPPMDTFHGPNVVIDRLFDYAPDVLAPLVPRLEDVPQHRGFEASVRRKLESKLAVLAGDFSRLKALWERFDRKIFATLVWHPDLLDDIGDLRPPDGLVSEGHDVWSAVRSDEGSRKGGSTCGTAGRPRNPRPHLRQQSRDRDITGARALSDRSARECVDRVLQLLLGPCSGSTVAGARGW